MAKEGFEGSAAASCWSYAYRTSNLFVEVRRICRYFCLLLLGHTHTDEILGRHHNIACQNGLHRLTDTQD
jgi:hypothetical protein